MKPVSNEPASALPDAGRRGFLQASAALAGSLFLGLQGTAQAARLVAGESATEAALTAWVRITPAGEVILMASQAEIGQGITTTLAAALADELGARWDDVSIRPAPFAPAYRNPDLNWMFTGNSQSTQSFYKHMRKMGAAAREMLVSAAAAKWQVPVAECVSADSTVRHSPSGRSLSFAELASAAASLPVPTEPAIKPDSALSLIGRSLPKVDVPAKVTGKAQFGIDVKLPGLLIAALRTAPTLDGKLTGHDAAVALAMPGVKSVVPLENGVAVVADTWWHARTALQRMPVQFSAGEAAALDSASLGKQYRSALANGPWARTAAHRADKPQAAAAQSTFSAEYENPWAAHATLEPMNCTAHVTAERCEIWAPTQGQELAFWALKGVFGLPDDKIIVRRTEAIGGGFGRRLIPDFVVQAALISRAAGAPVKLIWDREEDFKRDLFRPASLVRLEAKQDAAGRLGALAAKVVSPTILLPVYPPIKEMLDKQGVDPSALEGFQHVPYASDALEIDFHLLRTPIPTSVMRTTGYGPNVFALECFIDELAQRAKQDPLAYRRQLLAHRPDALAVLDRVAKLSGWGKPAPKGVGRGLAFTEAFGSLLAQVVEVKVQGRAVKVLRVSSVVDCGRTLDPGIASAGIEGGIVFGMAYCKSEITFAEGEVQQRNFDRYALPYLAETPLMQTEFITSERPLGGIGEVSPITVPPALANAIFAATGRRLRSMPLSRHNLHFA